ncbi:hypothetical protein LPJ53_000982 [Coemansia erecta]|uniref:V-type proton ATPase subunit G n=2 Tax=Coemansia TaxID=4863 RepID=A0A9W7Y4Y0_9FUNG|nr:hypothetical protein LPJ53_000982 [Coemansia erecta]KAJ2786252.1 hypothetical protein GGI15_001658 [Coemansia interrupta]
MSASSSQGIHTLLEAEKEASKIVTQAREYRVKRLNNARTDAAAEIATIQERKNRELAEIQQKSVDQEELTQRIQRDTDERMSAIRQEFEQNKQLAVQKLVEAVTTVESSA